MVAMKAKNVCALLAASVMTWVAVSCGQTPAKKNIYVAWSNKQNSYSFVSTLKTIEAIGCQPVVLDMVRSTDLTYYIKGGRVSKVSGTLGGIFEICPLLCVSPEGKLKVISKVRTKKKVLTALVDKMEQHAAALREQKIETACVLGGLLLLGLLLCRAA